MRKENKRMVGSTYEQEAARFLKQHGYQILEMNYRCRRGEIDIVARNDKYLVFVEVKYRSDDTYGTPQEAVDKRKQRVISRVTDFYCLTHGCDETTPCRFDVVAFRGKEIHLIQNAYDYIPY